MRLMRSALWTLSLLCGFTVTGKATAQDDSPLPRPNFTVAAEVRKYQQMRGIPKDQLAEVQKSFATFAKFFAETVAHPLVHKAAQDPLLKQDSTGRDIPTVDRMIEELDRYLLYPDIREKTQSGSTDPKVNFHNADYIRELGAALDAAFKPLIEGNTTQVVRVNAMRVYAHFAKSGARAHWPTVTALVKNQNTPTEIKYYALRAAGNLLSAYDVYDYKSRRHALNYEPRGDAEKEIGALVAAVQECVVNPEMLLPLKDGKPTREQLDVIQFVRREAIKALGQVRFYSLPGPDGQTIYPGLTLVRVCVSDPKLSPPPSPAECGEAVIGLCRMSPNPGGNPLKGLNADALAEAVAAGMITFAGPRSSPFDRSLPWRGYALRMTDAFDNWLPLFNPLYDPLQNPVADASAVPSSVSAVVTEIRKSILTPMLAVSSMGEPNQGAQVEGLRQILQKLRNAENRPDTLISGVPATKLPHAAGN